MAGGEKAGTIWGNIVLFAKDFDKEAAAGQSKINKLFGGLENLAQKAKMVGVALVAAFTITAAAAGASVNQFAKVEKGLAEIKTLGVEKTISDIGQEVNALRRSFGDEAQTTIKGFYDSISAGVPAITASSRMAAAAASRYRASPVSSQK